MKLKKFLKLLEDQARDKFEVEPGGAIRHKKYDICPLEYLAAKECDFAVWYFEDNYQDAAYVLGISGKKIDVIVNAADTPWKNDSDKEIKFRKKILKALHIKA